MDDLEKAFSISMAILVSDNSMHSAYSRLVSTSDVVIVTVIAGVVRVLMTHMW